MVEAVDGVSGGVRSAVHRLEQARIPAGVETLHFDEHLESRRNGGERLRQGGDRLAVLETQVGDRLRGRLDDVPPVDRLIVMHDQLAVRRGMDVELDAVGTLRCGGPERRQGILELDARCAAVGDDERPHVRLSAFFAWIQSGSFSRACTTAMSSGRGSTDVRYAGYFAASSGSPSTVKCWCAYRPMRRLNFRSGTLSCRSRSGMNMLSRSTSFTISWR